MSLDTVGLDLTKDGVHRTDNDFAVSWVRNYGSGRVFVSTLGHTTQAWEHPKVQKMWTEAAKWVMGMSTDGDATPQPKPAN